jgi:hypothetical protein
MTTTVVETEFDVLKEFEKTVLEKLVQSFGLDFILLNDKLGGEVDTIHNVRQGIFATKKEKEKYQNRSKYDSHQYHGDQRYIQYNKHLSELKKQGNLTDGYTHKQFDPNNIINLDHIISANEIHNDPARILAEQNGVELANDKSNFAPTHQAINKAKNASKMSDFVESMDKRVAYKKEELQKIKEKLKDNSLSINEKQKLENKERNAEEYIKAFEAADKKQMLEKDKKAREIYNTKINFAYYSSSKFFKNTAKEAGKKGLLMGGRQAIGMIIAEIWFELKEKLPLIYKEIKDNFKLEKFLERVKETLENIFERVKARFNDLINSFKNGILSGIISSLHTTVMNIFTTSTKMVGKLIREMWDTLVQTAKVAFFNPDNLATGDLLKEILKLISFGISTLIGTIINSQLQTYLKIPFGEEISMFLSGLVSGVLMLGFTYFLSYSQVMNKIWDYLNSFKTRYEKMIEHMKQINLELDRYLMELSKLEFNLNTDELSRFSTSLSQTNNELERKVLLIQEIEKRGIDLGYDPKQTDGFKHHLVQIQKEYHGS